MPNPVQEPATSEDEQMRSALKDAAAVIRKLSPLCNSLNDLVDLIEFALISDAQLNLLKRELAPVSLKA